MTKPLTPERRKEIERYRDYWWSLVELRVTIDDLLHEIDRLDRENKQFEEWTDQHATCCGVNHG